MKNLKSLMVETRDVSVDFEALPGFSVTLGYMSKSVTRKLAKDATTSKMDGSGNVTPEFDQDKFMESFCKTAVKGWKGLTYSKLAQLMLIDEDQIDDLEEEVPFSHDNAYLLLKESTIFDNWVNERVSEIAVFRTGKRNTTVQKA